VKCVASTNRKYNQQKVIDSHKGKAWPATPPTFIFKKVCVCSVSASAINIF
jgi:hypothetical protein